MRNANQSRQGAAETEVKKPFLKGAPLDENTLRNSLAFFGILIVIVFVSFIACASASFDIVILRVLLNLAVVLVCGVIFYNNGAGRGAEEALHKGLHGCDWQGLPTRHRRQGSYHRRSI